jgi:hypothetical protein
MSALQHALATRKGRNRLLFASGLVLVAGIVAFLIVFLRDTGDSREQVFTNEPAQTAPKLKTVPLSTEARRVAGRFILTAVQRKNLEESWTLVAPSLRSGYTLKTWAKGNIPVVPYLGEIARTAIKVDISQPRYALVEALLLPKSDKIKAQMFFLEMRKIGDRWLVTSWVPRSNFAKPGTLNE